MTTDLKVGAAAVPEEKVEKKKHDEDDDSMLSCSDDAESDEDMFSSDDEPSPASLKELKKEFKARDELLDQLVQGIDPTYARMMRENEQAVRKQKMLQSKQKQRPNVDSKASATTTKPHCSSSVRKGDQNGAAIVEEARKVGLMERLYRMVAFDVQNMLPGVLVLILNCIAYTGFGQIVRSFVVLLSRNKEFESQQFLPAAMILLSVVILRFTGGMCDWVNEATNARIKFDMKNRLRLGKWDALVIKWFLGHEFIATYLNVFSFFTAYYAVYAYQEQALALAFDIRHQLFQELPSVKQGLMTSMSKRLATGLGVEHVQRVLGNATCAAGTCSLDEQNDDLDDLTLQDEAFLASSMSSDCYVDLMGNEDAILCTETVLFWFYTGCTIAALVVLRMMGHKFWSL